MFLHHYPTQDSVLLRHGRLGDLEVALAGALRRLRSVTRRDDLRGALRYGARPAGHLRCAEPVPRNYLGACQAGQWLKFNKFRNKSQIV